VVTPSGFDLRRTRAELELPGARAELDRLPRVCKIALADGNAFMNRPGPRLVESLDILPEIIHPEAFAFGHAGAGWQPL